MPCMVTATPVLQVTILIRIMCYHRRQEKQRGGMGKACIIYTNVTEIKF